MTEVSRVKSAPRGLNVAETAREGMRVAAVLENGLHIFDASGAGDVWKPRKTYPGITSAALAPLGFPVEFAASDRGSISVAETDGRFSVLLAGLKHNERVTELQFLTGVRPGVIAMIEERRAGRPAHVRVVHFSFTGGRWRPMETIVLFEASPEQSAMRACSTSDRAALAIGSNLVRDIGATLVTSATLFVWQAGASGTWQQSNELLGQGTEQSLASTLTFSPGAVEIHCGTQESIDLLFRSGGGWLMRSSADGRWTRPARILDYPAGYGVVGPGIAFCSGKLVWIDNRLERGTTPKPWNPTGGFPWSDDYPGWGINSVFAANVDELVDRPRTVRPALLSSETGRQFVVSATATGNGCIAVWSGQTSVPKAGATAEELVQRIQLTRL